MSCIRDNKVCTKCCEAIHLRKGLKPKPSDNGDLGFVGANWKKISTRMAKKRNPYLFDKSVHGSRRVNHQKRWAQYYTCKNLTDKGCGAYAERPAVCSKFPLYDVSAEYYHETQATRTADYSANCTLHYNIPIKFIEE